MTGEQTLKTPLSRHLDMKPFPYSEHGIAYTSRLQHDLLTIFVQTSVNRSTGLLCGNVAGSVVVRFSRRGTKVARLLQISRLSFGGSHGIKKTRNQSYRQIVREDCVPHCPRPTRSHYRDAGHTQRANRCVLPWEDTELSG